MILTSNQEIDIIKYEYDKDNKLVITCNCGKCKEIIEQYIYLDKITNIYCKKCKKILCLIPLEVNINTGKLIDFKIMTYYKVSKILKDKKIASILDKETNKKDKDRLQLKIIKDYILNNQYKNDKDN